MLLLLLACPPKKTPDSGGDTDAAVDDTAVVDGRWTGDASTEDAVEVLSGDLVDRALQTPEGLYLASPRFDNNTGQVCLDDACWTGAGAGASFGVSMAWVGELAVSAHQDSPNGQWSGAVHLLTSGVVLEGEEGDLAGIAVAAVNETLAIGGMGADTTALDGGIVYVLDDGPDDPELIEGTYLFGTDPGGYFGIDVAWAELDGDGAPDLLVGASGASGEMMGTGAAFAFHAPVEPWSRDLDADFSVRGAVTDDDTGKAVEGIDHDGDGLDEWVIGSPGAGRVDVVVGGEVFATLEGEPEGRLGFSLTAVDLDADGREDLVIGATRQGTGGQVLVAYGPFAGVATPELVIDASGEGDKLGLATGATDEGFWAGASRAMDGEGAVYLFATGL